MDRNHELANQARNTAILSAVSEAWGVDQGSGFDLLGVDKVRGRKLRPAPVWLNTANGSVLAHCEVGVWSRRGGTNPRWL